jgi:NADH:ubiquinone oxidoreductase subunit K
MDMTIFLLMLIAWPVVVGLPLALALYRVRQPAR